MFFIGIAFWAVTIFSVYKATGGDPDAQFTDRRGCVWWLVAVLAALTGTVLVVSGGLTYEDM